jgi:hypothetical protein
MGQWPGSVRRGRAFYFWATEAERGGPTFSTMTDPEIQKAWGQVRKAKHRLSPSQQMLQKRLQSGLLSVLPSDDWKMERDRSLADGRLKHQRTGRTIERVFDPFLTCPTWVRTGAEPESPGTGLKRRNVAYPYRGKSIGRWERDRLIADSR